MKVYYVSSAYVMNSMHTQIRRWIGYRRVATIIRWALERDANVKEEERELRFIVRRTKIGGKQMRDARNLTNSVHEKVPFLRMKLSQSFHEANRVFEQKRVQPVTDLHVFPSKTSLNLTVNNSV